MKANPFHKFLNKEDHLQIQIAQWLKLRFPKVIWMHPPNEGKRTPYEQYLYKQLGALSGASDMIMFAPRGKYFGLAMELKVFYKKGKNNPTVNQKRFLKSLNDENWCTCVAWTFEEATDIITDYMKGKEPNINYKY